MSYSSEPKLEKIGALEVARIQISSDLPTIILFHGYGANAFDLYPLGDLLFSQGNLQANWIFPNGILDIPIYPGMFGKAWFPIDMEALQEAMSKGNFRNFAGIDPPGLSSAREKAMDFIKELQIPISRLVLGGFSQGAMLSMDLSLRLPETPLGILQLSGTFLNEAVWRPLSESKKLPPILQSHGQYDPVLSYKAARDLEAMLVSTGQTVQFESFPGAHEIPESVLRAMFAYLKAIV